MDARWDTKKTDVLGDIRSAVESIRSESMAPPSASLTVTPDNWALLRDNGFIPKDINSWEDVKKWTDSLEEGN